MTADEIIRMARVAGVRDDGHRFEFSEYKYLERFAALVAGHEREACAKVCEAGIHNSFADWDNSFWDQCCENRAAAIRARIDK